MYIYYKPKAKSKSPNTRFQSHDAITQTESVNTQWTPTKTKHQRTLQCPNQKLTITLSISKQTSQDVQNQTWDLKITMQRQHNESLQYKPSSHSINALKELPLKSMFIIRRVYAIVLNINLSLGQSIFRKIAHVPFILRIN